YTNCGLRISDCGLYMWIDVPRATLHCYSAIRNPQSAIESSIRNPQSAIESSAQHTPAVHVEDLSGDVPRQVGAQEHDRSRDVLGARHAAQRDRPLDLAPPASRLPLIRPL